MWKQTLAFGSGILVGTVIVGICFFCYKKYKEKRIGEEHGSKVFAEKEKITGESIERFEELLSNQSYVELLTAKELTTWFKENLGNIDREAQMIIAYPTEDILRGLGYYSKEKLDTETNIIQLFYDKEKDEVLKIRLISYTDIESNLHATLIEQEGMMVVTN